MTSFRITPSDFDAAGAGFFTASRLPHRIASSELNRFSNIRKVAALIVNASAVIGLLGTAPNLAYAQSTLCDAPIWAAPPGASSPVWRPVHQSRIADNAYHGRVSETTLQAGGETFFLYRLLLNIRGAPIYEDVLEFNTPIVNFKIDEAYKNTRLRVRREAEQLLKASAETTDRLMVTDTSASLKPWSFMGDMYFTVEGKNGYVVFVARDLKLERVCSKRLL